MAASDEAGLQWQSPQLEVYGFLNNLAITLPRFALVTQEYLNDDSLFAQIRIASPQTRIVVCLTDSALASTHFWAMIDALDFDVACTLPELTDCLQTLRNERFYKSSLLQLTNTNKVAVSLPGFTTLTRAERRVLRGMCEQKTGPQLAEALFISEKTVNNHRHNIAQKLNVTGGPGSLTRYVINHCEQLLALLT